MVVTMRTVLGERDAKVRDHNLAGLDDELPLAVVKPAASAVFAIDQEIVAPTHPCDIARPALYGGGVAANAKPGEVCARRGNDIRAERRCLALFALGGKTDHTFQKRLPPTREAHSLR